MAPIRILLIESAAADSLAIRLALSAGGSESCLLTYAHNLDAALQRLARGTVDIILIDPALPGSPGLPAIRKIREAAPATPIFALLDIREKEPSRLALECGAQDFFLKGRFDGSALRSTLRYAAERSRRAAGR